MSSVTLTAATRQNLLSLQDTANLLSSTQNKLSTGKKVNSALDDPTSFFTSQALSGRSSDLSSLLNGISNGIQTIQAANQGITSIQKLVDSAKSTANQALADKSAISSGKAATAATVSASKSFQGLSGTSDGTQDFSTVAKDGSVDLSLDGGKTQTTIRLDASTLKGSGDLTKVTAEQVVSAINSQISNSAALKGKVAASVGNDGRIGFSTIGTGGTQQLAVRGSAGSTLDIGFGKDSTVGGPTGATQLLGTALSATTFGAAGSSTFTVSDGSQSVQVTLNKDTKINDAGDTFGTGSVSTANITAAIQKQLKDAGSTFAVVQDTTTSALKFTSQEVGPNAALTVTDTGGDVQIGLFTGTISAGTPAAGSLTAGATVTAGTAIDATATNNRFDQGKFSKFTVTDGGKSTDIVLDANSAIDTASPPATLGSLGATGATPAQLLSAINLQLSKANAGVTASLATGALVFTSGNTGGASGSISVSNIRGTFQAGFGTTTATAGTPKAGTGAAAVGLSATGSDTTDGSAKAVLTASSALTGSTYNFGTTGNATFSLKLGNNPAATIKIDGTSGATNTAVSKDEIISSINKQINADTGLSGKVTASLNTDNKIVFTTTNSGSDQTLTVNAAQTGALAVQQDLGFGKASATVTPAALTATGASSTGSTNSTRQSLAKQFNELLNQITQQAKDSSYNGINLLYRSSANEDENSLKVAFNETGSSSLSIKGTKLDSDGLGLNSVTGGFQTDDEITKTLASITTATSQLRAQASTFGSNLSVVQNRQDFSKNLITILDNGSANLTNADLNEEAANSQALSTRNSIATSALSLANQAQQGILQLLR